VHAFRFLANPDILPPSNDYLDVAVSPFPAIEPGRAVVVEPSKAKGHKVMGEDITVPKKPAE
jgi:hypothetical protein